MPISPLLPHLLEPLWPLKVSHRLLSRYPRSQTSYAARSSERLKVRRATMISGQSPHRHQLSLTTSPSPPSGTALSVPREECSPLQRPVSANSFVSATTDTAVGHDGSPSPCAEPEHNTVLEGPIVDEPGSMDEAESDVKVFHGAGPLAMWTTARYEHKLL